MFVGVVEICVFVEVDCVVVCIGDLCVDVGGVVFGELCGGCF